jgi:hypothetical protein
LELTHTFNWKKAISVGKWTKFLRGRQKRAKKKEKLLMDGPSANIEKGFYQEHQILEPVDPPDNWWNRLNPAAQREYLANHPNSRKRHHFNLDRTKAHHRGPLKPLFAKHSFFEHLKDNGKLKYKDDHIRVGNHKVTEEEWPGGISLKGKNLHKHAIRYALGHQYTVLRRSNRERHFIDYNDNRITVRPHSLTFLRDHPELKAIVVTALYMEWAFDVRLEDIHVEQLGVVSKTTPLHQRGTVVLFDGQID